MASTTILPEYCQPKNAFLYRLSRTFDTCVPTPLAFVSTLLGSCSIVAWLFAQLPQIWTNHNLKSASGLSLYFLLEWLAGDTTNLLGAVLTQQASWQIIVASYYVFVDIVLFSQFVYFTYYVSRVDTSLHITTFDAEGFRSDESPEDSTDAQSVTASDKEVGHKERPPSPKPSLHPSSQFPTAPRLEEQHDAVEREKLGTISAQSHPYVRDRLNRLLLTSTMFAIAAHGHPVGVVNNAHGLDPTAVASNNSLETAGRVLSWVSTLLYLGSRLPQIYKNHVRKSTAGLAPQLFIAAFFGNLFYSSSIATNPIIWASYGPHGLHGWIGPDGNDRQTAIGLAAPFFLGAAGVLLLDGYIFAQFSMYGERLEGSKVMVVEDVRGRSRWQTVSGWMRGWVPSPSPSFGGDLDNRRPLLERDDRAAEDNIEYGSMR